MTLARAPGGLRRALRRLRGLPVATDTETPGSAPAVEPVPLLTDESARAAKQRRIDGEMPAVRGGY